MKNKGEDLEKEWKKLRGRLLLDIVNENLKKEKDKKIVKEKVNPWKPDNFVSKIVNVDHSTVLLEDQGLSDQSNLEQNINPFGSAVSPKAEDRSQKITNEPKYIESSNSDMYIDKNVSAEPTSLRPVMEDISKDMMKASFVDPMASRAGFGEMIGESDVVFRSIDTDNKKYMEKDSR